MSLVEADLSSLHWAALDGQSPNVTVSGFGSGHDSLETQPHLQVNIDMSGYLPSSSIHGDTSQLLHEESDLDTLFGPDPLIDINTPFDPMETLQGVANNSFHDDQTGAETADLTRESPAAPFRDRDSVTSFESFSLDHSSDFSPQIFGFTNESDPWLLNWFPFDTEDELKFFKIIYRKMGDRSPHSDHALARMDPAETLPVHFVRSHRQTVVNAVDMADSYLSGGGGEEADAAELRTLVNPELGTALVRL